MTQTFHPAISHLTANAHNGSSFFLPSSPTPSQAVSSDQISYIYSTPPAFSISSDTDLNHHLAAPSTPPLRSFPPVAGSTCMIIDLGPNDAGDQGMMHRTNTLDYVFVLEGEMQLTLDGGEVRMVKRGEVVVLRACMHAWKNPSRRERARFGVVSLGGEGAVEGAMEFPQ